MTRSVVLLTIFISLAAVISISHCQCVRQSEDKSSAPEFLCSYHANITRLTSCSTKVVETFIFPHNTGTPWSRVIPLVEGQIINSTSLSVRRNESWTSFTFAAGNQIIVKAPQSSMPVQLEFRYIIQNNVSRYTNSSYFGTDVCLLDNGGVSYKKYDLMIWSPGEWEKDVNILNVTFKTMNENVRLRFANAEDTFEPWSEVTVTRENVQSPIVFYVEEVKIYRSTLAREMEMRSLLACLFVLAIHMGIIVLCCCMLSSVRA